MQMHNCENTVNRIIDMKTRSQEYKEHPDSPGTPMFYVLIDVEKVDEDEHEDRLAMAISGEAHGEQVPHSWWAFVPHLNPYI